MSIFKTRDILHSFGKALNAGEMLFLPRKYHNIVFACLWCEEELDAKSLSIINNILQDAGFSC